MLLAPLARAAKPALITIPCATRYGVTWKNSFVTLS
jgi:hypothetical protein